MGLQDGKCESCKKKSDVLFPIGILDETPTGDQMVRRWYCIACKEEIEAEADEAEPEEPEDEEEEEDEEDERCAVRRYDCGCRYEEVNESMDIWKRTNYCLQHSKVEEKDPYVSYECGCQVELITVDIFTYVDICDKHI